MLRKLRPRSIYDVMAAIACFGVLAGGTAYAENTIRSGDIVDNEVTTTDVRDDTLGFGGLLAQDLAAGSVRSSEVADNSLTGADIANGSLILGDIGPDAILGQQIIDFTLKDEDVGEAVKFDIPVDIGTLTATSCVNKFVNMPAALADHIVLTPSTADANGALMYDVRYNGSGPHGNDVTIHVCNFASATINDGITHFNLLAFNAKS